MSAGFFLIAILGCGEAEAPCEAVRRLATRYQTRAECVAATEAAVLGNSDVDYPVVVAQCVAADGGGAIPKADQVERPGPRQAPAARPLRS